jgi:hypothetical protein
MQSSSRDFFESIGLFVLGLVLFTYGVRTEHIIGFESRFYLFAIEMWRQGPSWFPTTYGAPYPDYPATSTFLIYLVAQFLGHLNKLAAVLPTAIAASLTMVMTYRIAALQSKRWGIYAVCFLLMTITFFTSARSINIDMLVTFVTATCFYVVYSADVYDSRDRLKLVYLLLLFGFACRGPMGLVTPAGVVCMYYLQDGNLRRLLVSSMAALSLLVVSVICLLGIANATGGYDFTHAVINREVLGRMGEGYLPPYFYFTMSLTDYALSFPLAVLAVLGVLYYEQRLHDYSAAFKLLLKCVGWALIILVGLSIPGDKKIRYILPATPAFALLASYWFIAPKNERYFVLCKWLMVKALLAFPLILLIGLRIASAYMTQHGLRFPVDQTLVNKLFFSLFGLTVSVFVFLKKKPWLQEVSVVLFAVAGFLIAYFLVVRPVQQSADHTHELVSSVEAIRRVRDAKLVFVGVGRDSWPIKYLANTPGDVLPRFVAPSALAVYSPHNLFIMNEEDFRILPTPVRFHVIKQGHIGQRQVVVFE